VSAQTNGFDWSITPMLGTHNPALDVLNEQGFKAPVVGVGTVGRATEEGTEGAGVQQSFRYDAPLPDLGLSTNAGLEFEWIQNSKHSFLMGISTWEGTANNSLNNVSLPLQGDARNADYDRRASLSYNEFYFGWKYRFFSNENKYRLYSRLSLNEVFDIDFREEHVFSIKGGELDDVKRIIVGNGQTTGVLMVQLGMGGEYFIKNNLSIGVEGSYYLAERPFQLKAAAADTDVQFGDDITILVPIRPSGDETVLGYHPVDTPAPVINQDGSFATPPIQKMDLRLDGWKLFFRITLYY
jgi:hypothetical protein